MNDDNFDNNLKFTYDDVLLVPRYSRVLPKSVDLRSDISKNITLNFPIISAAMDTLTNGKMAIAMALNGGLGIIHKNQSIELQMAEIKKVKEYSKKNKVSFENNVNATIINGELVVGAAVGIGEDVLWYSQKLINAGVDVLCVDSAHAHTSRVIETIKLLTSHHPNIPIIAGNVVTIEGAEDLIKAGAKIIKVGLGGGSICITRKISGVGMPQFSAVYDICRYIKEKYKDVLIIADGGIVYSGDITKALGAGADFVMVGNLLASAEESGGKNVLINKEKYKVYEGMGSKKAMARTVGSNRYFHAKQSTSSKYIAEGVSGYVKVKGKLKDILYDLMGGVKSGFGYCGSLNIEELHKKAKFVRITRSAFDEGLARNIKLKN